MCTFPKHHPHFYFYPETESVEESVPSPSHSSEKEVSLNPQMAQERMVDRLLEGLRHLHV